MHYWTEGRHGVIRPIVQNAMTRNAFDFLRRFIHFENNKNQKHGPVSYIFVELYTFIILISTLVLGINYDPLWKIQTFTRKIISCLSEAWTTGDALTVDESMIKYRGKAVSFTQYNPLKPIKHGIKVFALCCSYSAYLLGFEVYLGKEYTKDGDSALQIIDRLLLGANLTSSAGRKLYVDNWYMTVDLAKHMYEQYGWTVVGTMTPTEKKVDVIMTSLFLRLSNGGLKEVKRGWFREAVIEIKNRPKRRRYFIQCTTWKDKKQVMFLHTHLVGRSSGYSVRRHVRGNSKRIALSAPRIQADYAKHFNAVDRNDRDSADYSCSVRTSRWYLRIVFWLVDRVVFSCFIIVCALSEDNRGPEQWKRYTNRNGGRRAFQIDLAILLINYGIEYDWDGETKKA